jgi:hypothetical protein
MAVTLNLKPEVEAGLLAQAQASGMSLEAFAELVLREKSRESSLPTAISSEERPIWEVITDIVREVPDEVFDRLPKDGASEVDHYLYGLPKRH